MPIPHSAPPAPRPPLYKNLTVQVLAAIAIGLTIGALHPQWGKALQPLGDAFIRLVKMVVGPIVFLTIVLGISSMGSLKKVGRVGGKALLYFEIVTTLALAIGLLVANILQPGAGFQKPAPATAPFTLGATSTQPASSDAGATTSSTLVAVTTAPASSTAPAATPAEISKYVADAQSQTFVQFLLNIIPDNIVGAFAKGDLLQILFLAILSGIALTTLGTRARPLIATLEQITDVMFGIVALIMKFAPLGALGAIAYTIGNHGLSALLPLLKLMACVYLTMALFIFLVLGSICRAFGLRLLPYLAFIKEEILLVLGTSSSESALPRMMQKLERLGCGKGVVSLVIPAGYSFNLDGTSIYLSMAVLFIAQAYHVPLSLPQQLSILAILMLTSKGAAAVTGGGFVTLAATLTATHTLPIEGLALLLGVDRFMSEARAITNLIGNGVATMVVSKLEHDFNHQTFETALAGHLPAPASPLTQ